MKITLLFQVLRTSIKRIISKLCDSGGQYIPAGVAGVVIFGLDALWVILVAVVLPY